MVSWVAVPTSPRVGPSVPARPAVRSTGAEKLGLVVGEHVVHDRFGAGVVLSVEGTGSHSRAAVNFDDHGTKQLVLAMTPLRRVSVPG